MRRIIKTLFSVNAVAKPLNQLTGISIKPASVAHTPWMAVTIISAGVARIKIATSIFR